MTKATYYVRFAMKKDFSKMRNYRNCPIVLRTSKVFRITQGHQKKNGMVCGILRIIDDDE